MTFGRINLSGKETKADKAFKQLERARKTKDQKKIEKAYKNNVSKLTKKSGR